MTNRGEWPHQILQGHAVPCFQWVRVRVLAEGMQGAAVDEEEGYRFEMLHAQLQWGCPIGLCAVEADERKPKG